MSAAQIGRFEKLIGKKVKPFLGERTITKEDKFHLLGECSLKFTMETCASAFGNIAEADATFESGKSNYASIILCAKWPDSVKPLCSLKMKYFRQPDKETCRVLPLPLK